MKTVLITITRGLLARNILRCGVLQELLRHDDVQVVIAMPRLEDYFQQEFASPRVRFELLPAIQMSWMERLVQPWYRNLVFTETEELCTRWGNNFNVANTAWWVGPYIRLMHWLGKRAGFKQLMRRLVAALIPAQQSCLDFLGRIQPTVVFCTDVQGVFDVALLRAAKCKKIPTVAMTKGWENASRRFYWMTPDRLLVQNEQVYQDALQEQLIPPSQLTLTGFPQFDQYQHPQAVVVPRVEHLKRLGFAADRKVILFGSEGVWSAHDDRIVEQLIESNQRGTFGAPCGIIVRPHFSDANNPRYERFRGLPDVFVDDRYRLSPLFHDRWDPGQEDMAWFVNHLAHLDVLVTFASTLTLDAAMFDKPVINVAYGGHLSQAGDDVTAMMYQLHHYLNILASQGVALVSDPDALVLAVREALSHPGQRAAGRATLRATYCKHSDGQAAQRIAQAIYDLSA